MFLLREKKLKKKKKKTELQITSSTKKKKSLEMSTRNVRQFGVWVSGPSLEKCMTAADPITVTNSTTAFDFINTAKYPTMT